MNANKKTIAHPRRLLQTAHASAVGFVRWLELIDQVRRERQMLAGMDERQLGDLGISQATAENESARSVFDVPKDRLPPNEYPPDR